jgi:polyadenylate-binding protein 2
MEDEHEVYGGDIPEEVEGELEGELDGQPENGSIKADDVVGDDAASKELEEMKKRLKEMEEEAAALRDMQAKVEKEMSAVQDPAGAAAALANKEEADARSVFVGNVLFFLAQAIIEPLALCVLCADLEGLVCPL